MGNSNFPASKLIKYWHEVTADSTTYHGKSISSHLIFLVKSFRIINETEAGKTKFMSSLYWQVSPTLPLFKAANTPGSFNRVSLAFTILGLLDLIYSCADLAEKWRPENGKISFKKNLDLFMWQKWKMPTPGERINMKEREDIMRMSLFPWGFQFTLESVTQLTHRVLFPESLRNKEECKKTIVTRRIQTVELLQQEIAEKNPECRV